MHSRHIYMKYNKKKNPEKKRKEKKTQTNRYMPRVQESDVGDSGHEKMVELPSPLCVAHSPLITCSHTVNSQLQTLGLYLGVGQHVAGKAVDGGE